MNNNVYKILREYEWEEAKESGQIITALDKKDGFIHLSTALQLAGTLSFLQGLRILKTKFGYSTNLRIFFS